MNTRLAAEPELNGVVIDLGGGGEPSYKKILKINGSFINMDAIAEANPTVVGNLEGVHPFDDCFADAVLLFNTLEHVYDHQHVVNEIFRVLKPGGKALVSVPFLCPVHTLQTEAFLVDDYFRYTQSALKNIFNRAGFSNIDVEPSGGVFLAIAEFLGILISWKGIRFPMVLFFIGLEKLYRRVRPGVSEKRYPLTYFVVARK